MFCEAKIHLNCFTSTVGLFLWFITSFFVIYQLLIRKLVKPACLPTRGDQYNPSSDCIISGWGAANWTAGY